ncbi:hypothetical protein KPATCC21470_8671 [Kitasatospora purpeofusca]
MVSVVVACWGLGPGDRLVQRELGAVLGRAVVGSRHPGRLR